MIQVRRLGSVTLTTRDLSRQLDYYTRIIGLTPVDVTRTRAVLATRLGQEAVILEQGEADACIALALQVSPRDDFRLIASQLDKENVSHEWRSDVSPAIAQTLSFHDPKGTRVDLFADYKASKPDNTDGGISPFKLGHVAFTTTDVQRVVRFYKDVLGFRISDWRGDFFYFLRCGPDHHSVNFIGGEANGVHHLAFELRDWAEIQRACDFLAAKDIRLVLGPIRHIIGHNIAMYHRNTDEILIEFFTEIDQMKDEELGFFEPRPWHQDRPQLPKMWDAHTLTNYWGPGRLVSKDK